MDHATLKKIVTELHSVLPGRFLGRIFQLSSVAFALDFGLKRDGFLFLSVDPASPRLYLIKRTTRELQKDSVPPSAFANAMKALLSGGNLPSVSQDEHERVVRFLFARSDEIGDPETRILVTQLTGRSANVFLLDANGRITHRLRDVKGEGQQVGEDYKPPAQTRSSAAEPPVEIGVAATISQAVDEYFRKHESRQKFESLAKQQSDKLRKEVTRAKKLRTNLLKDLEGHGKPEEHKRLGELLTANIGTAKRRANKVTLQDYYAEGVPTIELEVDENRSLQELAAEYFSRYTKSKRAVEEIAKRLSGVEQDLVRLDEKRRRLNEAIATGDESVLGEFAGSKPPTSTTAKKKKESATLPGMRHYRSSDGYEVIVGRAARDNDTLTFRVARPNDLWLHAGDYPGSHVIVRNSTRKEVPHRTIVEAAQLAAKFSQASKDSKVVVHYTPRKFISKPKGAAAGLVRLSTFRSITVEPGENIERQKQVQQSE